MILILGDTHIPSRAVDLPEWVKRIVERGWNFVIHTGDVNEGWVLEYLSHYGELVAVKGNTDFIHLPSYRVLDLPLGKTLVVHGHQVHPRGNLQALSTIADRFSANVVIHGHTHIVSLERCCGKLFINPGTATGSWGGSYRGGDESIIVVDEEAIKIYINGNVSKLERVFI